MTDIWDSNSRGRPALTLGSTPNRLGLGSDKRWRQRKLLGVESLSAHPFLAAVRCHKHLCSVSPSPVGCLCLVTILGSYSCTLTFQKKPWIGACTKTPAVGACAKAMAVGAWTKTPAVSHNSSIVKENLSGGGSEDSRTFLLPFNPTTGLPLGSCLFAPSLGT